MKHSASSVAGLLLLYAPGVPYTGLNSLPSGVAFAAGRLHAQSVPVGGSAKVGNQDIGRRRHPWVSGRRAVRARELERLGRDLSEEVGLHASVWKFSGDPDDLLRRYDAMVRDIPAANMRLHLCLRARDGIVMVDTCPSREAFAAFASGPGFRSLRERHGLPEPTSLEDFPVHVAFVDGASV